MSFYDLSPHQRAALVQQIGAHLQADLEHHTDRYFMLYCDDEDTYIRKSAYLCAGRIFFQHELLREPLLRQLELLMNSDSFRIRQTAVNAAGEIGIKQFELAEKFMEKGLFDPHHAVRNAVIGSIKKMGQKNHIPVLKWARNYLHHEDKEIRREICHGIELRGRTHPTDILPLLKELEFDQTSRVKNTLVHVLGQIAYKKGCLQDVVRELKTWTNKELVQSAYAEIVDVHYRYRNFSALTQQEARTYILEQTGMKV